jgi:hypothetical protein
MPHPITRTSWIDDDGTGTTGTIINNAEKQTLYNQIDAAIIPTYGSWTPTDASGAALVFISPPGTFAKYGRLVFVWLQLSYPTTSNGATAKIGGLPFVVRTDGGAWQGWGFATIAYFSINTSEMGFVHPTTGVLRTNADMSGSVAFWSAVYLTD